MIWKGAREPRLTYHVAYRSLRLEGHGGRAQGRRFVSPIPINVPEPKTFADAIIDVDTH